MKNLLTVAVLFVLVGCLLCSCASGKPFTGVIPSIGAGPNESIVIVKRTNNFTGSAVGIDILIDGQKRSSVNNGQATAFTVPNGNHTIQGAHPWGGLGSQPSHTIPFEVQSQKITFTTGYRMSMMGTIDMIREGTVALEGNVTNRQITTGNTGNVNNRKIATEHIEEALARAAQVVLEKVAIRSKIAIVYITSPDRSITDYISGELEYIWVKEGYVITDRSQLDSLRQEQSLHLSGEIDDATAVSIGKFAGADIIVTGRVDGEGDLQRLRLRALDTQTAQVVGVASERL